MEKIPVKKISSVVKKTSKKQPITNVFLISDIHFGVKKGSEEWREIATEYFEKFFFPLLETKKDEGSIVLCLGDIFDDRNSINIAANDLAINTFERMSEMIPVYIINGNHDMYKKSNNAITSLRSFDNIPNLTIFKDPTIWTVGREGDERTMLLIPHQGDFEKETGILTQNPMANFTFMHTDIKNLHYENGMTITMGVDASSIKGQLFSGHIHKREELKNMVYVGSPYQLKRSEMGNKKGIYQLNLSDGSWIFHENKVSPEFVQISLDDILSSTDEQLEKIFKHNFVDILILEEDKAKVKVGELYDRLSIFKPQFMEIKDIPSNHSFALDEEVLEYKEKTIEEVVNLMIDTMEIKDETIDREKLKAMNIRYQQLWAEKD